MAEELTCPPLMRPPLETGRVTIYRPRRNKRRRYTSKDLARVYRYVACNETPKQALCASLVAAGKDEAISRSADQLLRLRRKLEAYDTEDPFSSLTALVFTLLQKIREIDEKIKARRFLRFLARRILLAKLISEVIDFVLDLSDVLEAVIPVLKELDDLVGECDCRKLDARLE